MVSIKNASIDQLFEAILKLKDVDECYKFFEDVLTIKEINEMAKRLDTAILLDQGESYENITKKIGTSAATISRVARCLNYGDGGYKAAIKSLKGDE